MLIENICTKKTYTSNGKEKTLWLNVGILKTTGDGKRYIELNMFPGTPFYVFEKKEKESNGVDNF